MTWRTPADLRERMLAKTHHGTNLDADPTSRGSLREQAIAEGMTVEQQLEAKRAYARVGSRRRRATSGSAQGR